MGTARSADEFLVTGALENENTMMTEYWLEFVAARDGMTSRSADSPEFREIHARLQEFSQKIQGLLENQTEIRRPLETAFPEDQISSGTATASESEVLHRHDPKASQSDNGGATSPRSLGRTENQFC